MEVQETLGQEWLKFMDVGAIELVQFPDSSLNGRFPGVVEAIGESAKGLCEIRQYVIWSSGMRFRTGFWR